jgi:hypothetical protein
VVYFFSGIKTVLEQFFPINSSKLVTILVILILIIFNSFQIANAIHVQKATNFPYSGSSEIVKWNSFENIFSWIKQNTKLNDIVVYGLDTMNYLYTGRSGIRPFLSRPNSLFYGDKYPATGTIEDLCEILNYYKPKYLIQSPMPRFSEEEPLDALIYNFLNKYPKWLLPVYVEEDERFKIYEINYQVINPK